MIFLSNKYMADKKRRIQKRKITVPKSCYFCKEEKTPWYSAVADLQKFVSDRGKIITRTRTGLCAKHQRRLTSAVKHARHLALMPFVGGE
jgi:small subunit ribosomal protein S18